MQKRKLKVYKIRRLLLVESNKNVSNILLIKENIYQTELSKSRFPQSSMLRFKNNGYPNENMLEEKFFDEIKPNQYKFEYVQDKFGLGLIPSCENFRCMNFLKQTYLKEDFTFHIVSNSSLFFLYKFIKKDIYTDFKHDTFIGYLVAHDDAIIKTEGYKDFKIPKGNYEMKLPMHNTDSYQLYISQTPK